VVKTGRRGRGRKCRQRPAHIHPASFSCAAYSHTLTMEATCSSTSWQPQMPLRIYVIWGLVEKRVPLCSVFSTSYLYVLLNWIGNISLLARFPCQREKIRRKHAVAVVAAKKVSVALDLTTITNGSLELRTWNLVDFDHRPTNSFIHLFIHSFVRSFVPSFVRSFVRSFVCSFVRSFNRPLFCSVINEWIN
jgi:hypothetical protein